MGWLLTNQALGKNSAGAQLIIKTFLILWLRKHEK